MFAPSTDIFRYYTKARDVLHQYQHMSSFRDIQQDCEVIVKDLRDCLKDHFRDPKVKISFTPLLLSPV